MRQYYVNNNEYLSYAKNYHKYKNNENYKLLLSDTSQQILRIVDRNFKSFFGLLKLKSQGKYTEKIRVPHYKKEFEPISVDKNNYLSIDMGLDNFATCFNSNNGSSFIIDGRYIKSINRHYNKQKAYYQSILDRQNIKVSKKILNLSRKRYNKINRLCNFK